MFTGIITDLGTVRAISRPGDTRIEITTQYEAAGIAIGASIACSGPCLTVVARGVTGNETWFAVEVSGETLSRTNIGTWKPGTRVNLERALRVGDELGGHIVTGHVDGLGRVVSAERDAQSLRVEIEAPETLMRYIAPKGSICIDGVSLTVNDVAGTRFGVNLIPHTQSVTSLGALAPGRMVNLEIDALARYVERLLPGGVRP
ncbi:MAG TPA: riboflavin synthase [Micropepsaceae bacterium]|nr:riboflavin synthase [Micropepsaceae bacterium]